MARTSLAGAHLIIRQIDHATLIYYWKLPMSDDPAPCNRARVEWTSQEAFWTFLQKSLPHGAMCRSVDEAAKRTREANLRRHARGCLGGFGDIYVFWDNVTVWLEAKAKTSTSANQDSFRELILRNGGHYAKVRTLEQVEAALRAAGIPLRATLGDIRERIEAQNERLPPKRKVAARKPRTGTPSMSVAQYRKFHARGLL